MNRLYADGQRVSFPCVNKDGLAFGNIVRMNEAKSFAELRVSYDVKIDGRDGTIILYETSLQRCYRDLPRAVSELVKL